MSFASLEGSLLAAYIREVHARTGISMELSKGILLRSRLRRRATKLGLDSFEAYLTYLRDHPEEERHFVDAVTTNMTSFFRTRSVWRYLADTWAPEQRRTVDLWSAACSTGEEPASLALVSEARLSVPWRVLASDVSRGMVEQAATQRFEVRKLVQAAAAAPAKVPVQQAFDPDGALHGRLKAHMRFRQHNLFDAPPRRFDLILARNVLIYFSPTDKLRVVRRLLGALKPDGMLVIGESESLVHLDEGLTLVQPCCYRRAA